MRKSTKLMAGLGVVAGLGVALAPLASFATDAEQSITDTINVTINSSCALEQVGSSSAASSITETFTAPAINPGAQWTAVTTEQGGPISTVDIACNAGAKYTVTATPTDLTSQQNSNHKLTSYTVAYSLAGTAGTQALTGGTAVNIADKAVHPGTDVTFAVTNYTGNTTNSTPAGVYTGTVTYTFGFFDANAQ